jgi:hypothetical protein
MHASATFLAVVTMTVIFPAPAWLMKPFGQLIWLMHAVERDLMRLSTIKVRFG